MEELIGIGVYTPAEAGRLLHVSAAKIGRWLRGHRIGAAGYDALWTPQIQIGDGHIYLGFRDLMEVRVADRFIELGVSAQRVRSAIELARKEIGEDRPLSTNRFRTDGRDIFLHTVERDEHGQERERLLNLFRKQYEFAQVIEPLLKTIDFDPGGAPGRWWPHGRRERIVLDPARAFGQPIDSVSGVPTAVLAAAAKLSGTKHAAVAYDVSEASIRRAVKFEASPAERLVA